MRALTLAALIAGACARPLLIGYGAPSDKASVTLRGTGAGVNVTGTLTLVETPKGDTMITGEIFGLKEGLHGFHIHQFGNLTDGCLSTGAHYNPEGHDHGSGAGAGDKESHAGDLGNIRADFFGVAFVNKTYTIPLFDPEEGSLVSILGRAIVVHELEDDLGKGNQTDSKTTGHAGGRLACGVVGLD